MTLTFPTADADAASGERTGFAFAGPGGTLAAAGTPHPVPSGPAATLETRLHAAFARDGAGAIGGALPFDGGADDCLWHAAQVRRAVPGKIRRTLPRPRGLRAVPSPDAYAAAVSAALERMESPPSGAEDLRKVVLARTLEVLCDAPIPIDALLARLSADRAVTAYDVPLPQPPGTPPRRLVGATPELLLRKRGARIASHPLAGSARRSADPAADRAAAETLRRSDKDRREHAIVVEFILDTLAPHCRDLSCPDGTGIAATDSLWHLGTRIEGALRDDTASAATLAAALHPTPAVCGLPRDPAAVAIRDLEPVDRGFYAGAVGWCDASGDGDWFVAIRCAEIRGAEARLFAGAGIVPGSDPAAETAETAVKFAALLTALGLPADAALTDTTD